MLTLIDGSGLAVRAQQAMRHRPLADSHGRITSTLVAFLGELAKATDLAKPSAVVVAWDSLDPTLYRHLISASYKPRRIAGYVDPLLAEVCARLGITQCVEDGFEADDLIATYWRKTTGPMRIVSGDKDLYQLIDDDRDVAVIRPGDDEPYTEIDLMDQYRCSPEVWGQALAYAGDKADGVVGMPHVGYITATKEINKYGSLHALLAHDDFLGSPSSCMHLDRIMANISLVDLRTNRLGVSDPQVPIPDVWDPPLEDVAAWLDSLDAHATAFRVTHKWGWGLDAKEAVDEPG